MFIAHLPAGYLATRFLLRRMDVQGVNPGAFLAAGLAGSVAPDLDLFYFYLIDDRANPHHSYVTHLPAAWLALAGLLALLSCFKRVKAVAMPWMVFALNGLLHLALDTVAGGIRWLAPFYTGYFSLFKVEPLYRPWWLNFFLDWTFAIELAIVLAALIAWRRKPPPVQCGKGGGWAH